MSFELSESSDYLVRSFRKPSVNNCQGIEREALFRTRPSREAFFAQREVAHNRYESFRPEYGRFFSLPERLEHGKFHKDAIHSLFRCRPACVHSAYLPRPGHLDHRCAVAT